ncbi:MAG: EF-hand domain-containing protein [Sphingomicrobium sp.]
MNKLVLGGAAAALAIAIGPAFAQVAPPPGVAQGTQSPRAAPAPMSEPQMRVRVMTNRTMTRDEVTTHIRDMFARLDTNKDGYITRPELDAMRDKMMSMRSDIQKRLSERGVFTDRGAAFDRLDANRDGSISRQEFTAARPRVRTERVVVMRDGNTATGVPGDHGMRMHRMGMGFGGRLFDMADANHDGRVSLAEAQSAALAHFDKADVNHDGKITPDERQQMRQVIRMERRGS